MNWIDQKAKIIMSNFFSLSALNVFNYLIPILILPYIIRRIGIELFGVLIFTQAFANYFKIFVEYGLNITLTKETPLYKNNSVKLSQFLSAFLIIRLSLFSILLLPYFSIGYFVFDIERYGVLFYVFNYTAFLGDSIFPIWLFQGVQKMKYITYLNVLAKMFYLVGIFLFVKGENDLLVIPLITSITFLISGLGSLILASTFLNVNLTRVNKSNITNIIRESFWAFTSNLSVGLYTSSNKFFLGLLTSNHTVGIYGIAEKVYSAFVVIINAFNRSIYPYLTEAFNASISFFKIKIVRIERVFFLVLIFISLFVYLTAPVFVFFLTGERNEEIINVLKILSLALIFAPFGGFYTQLYILLKKGKLLAKIVFVGFVINIFLVFLFVPSLQASGLAYIVLLIQMYIFTTKRIMLEKVLNQYG